MGGMAVPPMWNSVLNLLFPRFLPNCQAIKNCLRTQSLGYFHFIQDFAYNFIRRHVHGFCFVSQADTVAKHIVSNCTNILGNYVTATFDERITALPQISNEREILMGYFEKRLGAGFDYAYRYPGMNKVLQAAGRVIRTVEDVGVIELLDERFLQSEYRALFPREWEQQTICRVDTVEQYLKKFWNRS